MIGMHACSDSRIICCPVGDLDQAIAGSLRRLVSDTVRSGVEILIDLRDVGYMDAAGVSALADCVRLVRAVGGTARVCNPSPRVRWRLELLGIESPQTLSSTAVDHSAA